MPVTTRKEDDGAKWRLPSLTTRVQKKRNVVYAGGIPYKLFYINLLAMAYPVDIIQGVIESIVVIAWVCIGVIELHLAEWWV